MMLLLAIDRSILKTNQNTSSVLGPKRFFIGSRNSLLFKNIFFASAYSHYDVLLRKSHRWQLVGVRNYSPIKWGSLIHHTDHIWSPSGHSSSLSNPLVTIEILSSTTFVVIRSRSVTARSLSGHRPSGHHPVTTWSPSGHRPVLLPPKTVYMPHRLCPRVVSINKGKQGTDPRHYATTRERDGVYCTGGGKKGLKRSTSTAVRLLRCVFVGMERPARISYAAFWRENLPRTFLSGSALRFRIMLKA